MPTLSHVGRSFDASGAGQSFRRQTVDRKLRALLLVRRPAETRLVIRRVLRAETYTVNEAYVENCVSAFERLEPDLVVLPESRDGCRAAREIRCVPGGENALLVLAESTTDRISPEATRDVGVDFVLSAPHEPETVRRQVVIMTGHVEAQAARRMEAEAATPVAREPDAGKTDFLAAMSHELRTPLNGILGVLQLLREGGRANKDFDELLETADTSAQRLTTLVNDVLDFSKLTSGILKIESVEFSLAEVVREAVALLATACQEKGLEVDLNLDLGGNDWVAGDPARIGQVLLNLLGNAIKFTERGKVSVRVSSSDCGEGARSVRVEVVDTGIGVPAEDVGALFKGFAQGDTSRTRRFDGSGLGLAISKGLAEAMGGGVGATSEHGVGSRFWFTAKVGFAQRHAATRTSRAQSASLGGLEGTSLLVAEDNRANQLVIRRTLEKFGASVRVVANGLEAVEVSQSESWDAILMDQHMPELDGTDAAVRIREGEGPNRSTPILALTASVLEEDRLRCAQAGMCRFLTKPVASHELCAVLREVLDESGWSGAKDGSRPSHAA